MWVSHVQFSRDVGFSTALHTESINGTYDVVVLWMNEEYLKACDSWKAGGAPFVGMNPVTEAGENLGQPPLKGQPAWRPANWR